MFAEVLKKIVDNIDGGIAAVVCGTDGVPVDSYVRQRDRVEIESISGEFSHILKQVRKLSDSLSVGGVEEFSVRAQRLVLIVRVLSPNYLIAIAMTPEGNFGKARYLARVATPELAASL